MKSLPAARTAGWPRRPATPGRGGSRGRHGPAIAAVRTGSRPASWATGGTASESCPFAFPWNVTGWPAISVPAGLTAEGLPIGAQFLAPHAGEPLLLGLAHQLEAPA